MNYDAFNDTMNTNPCDECVTPITDNSCCDNYVTTPLRSQSPLVCPGAPRRRHRQLSATEVDITPDFLRTDTPPVARILIPTIDTHKGRGILATDFIKPDPYLTQSARRVHILGELQNWLVKSMRLQTHAREVEYNCLPDLEAEVKTGTWPAARLCLVASRGNFDRIHDPQEKYHSAATWAYWVCYNYLNDGTPPASSNEELALGFVTTDRFADGSTIEDLWNWSPTHRLRCDTQCVGYQTDNLRSAPPLPDSDAEEDEEAADIEDTVCFQRVRIEAPAWMWFAAFVGSILYIWLVAYLVSATASR